jgi:hypothetical protein
MVEDAIRKAAPDGWTVSPGSLDTNQTPASDCDIYSMRWTISSTRYDLGHFEVRLRADFQQLHLIHSTNIHCFPPEVEEASLIRLEAFTHSGLSATLRQLMETHRPNLVHPT